MTVSILISTVHLVLDYGLYPKAIGEILQSYNVREMHLTFTQGRWNYEEWGYPPTLSAGTGVELWAWMKDSTEYATQPNGHNLLLIFF